MIENHSFLSNFLGNRQLANFASHAEQSRGRRVFEEKCDIRTDFQRDRDRIIHSYAFRRLKHKTQVFIAYEGEHYRTRLTHSLEVAQIARSLARALSLDEDLAEAIALVHDFGHPPFGHAGEKVLAEMMKDYGGFDHNAQALRIVTQLENRYIDFSGLNLTWETLEGMVKHNGPLLGAHAIQPTNVSEDILYYNQHHDLNLSHFAGAEAQCAAIADDIAYNAHDLDDGLSSGLLCFEQLQAIPFWNALLANMKRYGDKNLRRYRLVRQQITLMVKDVMTQSIKNLSQLQPQNVTDIYLASGKMIDFSPQMQENDRQLKNFLYKNLYFHKNVQYLRQQAEQVIADLFNFYRQNPKKLPEPILIQWQKSPCEGKKMRIIADFLANMTDRMALNQHRTFFVKTPPCLII